MVRYLEGKAHTRSTFTCLPSHRKAILLYVLLCNNSTPCFFVVGQSTCARRLHPFSLYVLSRDPVTLFCRNKGRHTTVELYEYYIHTVLLTVVFVCVCRHIKPECLPVHHPIHPISTLNIHFTFYRDRYIHTCFVVDTHKDIDRVTTAMYS